MADVFLARGLPTFGAVCAWVRELPYGSNSRLDDPLVLFEDGRGTCMTKHGVTAMLAEELGLPIRKQLGFYRLTDDIITGAGALLRPYGLSFVPTLHCFLEAGSQRIDLTRGNRTGKNRDLDEFDLVVPVAAWPSREELQQHYEAAFTRYCAIDPTLAAVGLTTVRELARACHALTACACAPAPVAVAISAGVR